MANDLKENPQYAAWEDWAAMEQAIEVVRVKRYYQEASTKSCELNHAMCERDYKQKLSRLEDFKKRGYNIAELSRRANAKYM